MQITYITIAYATDKTPKNEKILLTIEAKSKKDFYNQVKKLDWALAGFSKYHRWFR